MMNWLLDWNLVYSYIWVVRGYIRAIYSSKPTQGLLFFNLVLKLVLCSLR
jgi:hypothetical protein